MILENQEEDLIDETEQQVLGHAKLDKVRKQGSSGLAKADRDLAEQQSE